MAKLMTMPKIGVNMKDATIVEWMVKAGDTVHTGDHIMNAETDKAVQEIFSTDEGIVDTILVPAGETVECLSPIALLRKEGETLSQKERDRMIQVGEREPETVRHATPQRKRVRISPLARKIASQHDIDISRLQPAQPGARIVKADVLSYIEQQAQIGTATDELSIVKTVPLSGTRRVIAEKMAESVRTNARAVLVVEADATRLIQWRENINRQGPNVGYNDLFVLIVGNALTQYPYMNSRLTGASIEEIEEINIGVAVDTRYGLTVAVVHSADRKGVRTINRELSDKIERALNGNSLPTDVSGGTFTITNLGMLDILEFIPVINPPQCAILGIGAIKRTPVVEPASGEQIVIRPIVRVSLAFDHRIVDGAPAAKFLHRVKMFVEEPLELLES